MRWLLLLAAAGVIGAMAWAIGLALQPPGPSAPLEQQAYIWQRQWDDDVLSAIRAHGDSFDRLIVLAAEITWNGDDPKVTKVPIDWRTLSEAGRPIGVALRINAYHGTMDAWDRQAVKLARVAKSVMVDAAMLGVGLAEVQLDFDAPTSKLGDYRRWVLTIRRYLRPTPITITALPSWLKSRDFAPLARATDGYVLQVHSLVKPERIDDPVTLCDVDSARQWVKAASRMAVPFRVALPTYGYVLAFDEAGEYIGLGSEGSPRNWPAGTQLKVIRADANAIAQLVADWRINRPMTMQGLLWYRMPIERDWLNWRWPTLNAVMTGRPPEADCGVVIKHSGEGLVELAWSNAGETDEPLDVPITVTWTGESPLDADGLAGYQWQIEGDEEDSFRGKGTFTPTDALRQAVVMPGEDHPIGWIRFTRDTEVAAHDPSQHLQIDP